MHVTSYQLAVLPQRVTGTNSGADSGKCGWTSRDIHLVDQCCRHAIVVLSLVVCCHVGSVLL